jgi:hypothetical protein
MRRSAVRPRLTMIMGTTMDTNTLYQAALADQVARKEHWGVARHAFADGCELICMIDKVAGRSITRGHYRTTYAFKLSTEAYSKPISRKTAVALLQAE